MHDLLSTLSHTEHDAAGEEGAVRVLKVLKSRDETEGENLEGDP